jgi:hypothetical protein
LRTGRIGLVLVVLAGAAATLAGVVALRLLRPQRTGRRVSERWVQPAMV